jgi:hypothetical protein
MIGSNENERVIDYRRIPLSCGQLNLSTEIPQNAFRLLAATRAEYLSEIRVFVEMDVQIQGSPGGFDLSPPVREGVKAFSHVCIVVNSSFRVLDRLSAV